MTQQGIEDAGLFVSTGDISSSFDLGDEHKDEFDLDYDPLRDQVGYSSSVSQSLTQLSFWGLMYIVQLGWIILF